MKSRSTFNNKYEKCYPRVTSSQNTSFNFKVQQMEIDMRVTALFIFTKIRKKGLNKSG